MMRRTSVMMVALLASVCLFWLPGCSPESPQPETKGKMSGGVMETGKMETGKMEGQSK